MSLVDVVWQLIPVTRKKAEENVTCWVFPKRVIGREFYNISELQEEVATFGEQIKEACIKRYGILTEEEEKINERSMIYNWKTQEAEIQYAVEIAEQRKKRVVYNAILHIKQNSGELDRRKAKDFLEEVLKNGVLANGTEPDSYMISRRRNGKSSYAETMRELGISVTESCDFIPNKGWVYKRTQEAA